jgi:hypothetical protein
MTRRHLINILLAGSASTQACTSSKADVLARLNKTARAGDLTIIDVLTPEIMTTVSPDAGRLILPERPGRLSLAPDGAWVAWFSYSSTVYPESAHGPLVYFTDDPRSARTVRIKGRFGAWLAISSGAQRLGVAVVRGDQPTTRLVVLKPLVDGTEDDITELITRFNPREIECLRFSASGDRLVAGSRRMFSVIDLPLRKVLFEGEGRSPSISPSGEVVAFVDQRRRLTVTTVGTGATKRLLERSITHGVGSWTPDGALVLAGIEGPLSFFWYLSAVDCLADAYAEIIRLEEHDSGEACGLIKRRLLSPN